MRKIVFIVFLSIVTSSAQASECLKLNDFRKFVEEFCSGSFEKRNTLTTPVTGKKFKAPVFLKLNEIITDKENLWIRKTKLDVCAPLDKEGDGKEEDDSTSLEDRAPHEVIGEVLLYESPKNDGPDGKFSLHFIEINEEKKGGGYGSSALDLAIMLARRLANKSSFYSTLQLQCSDYEEDRYLGDVPFRLSYYLNHGFSLAAETLEFMKHIDLRYFTGKLSEKTFKSFLKDYETLSQDSSIKQFIRGEDNRIGDLLEKVKISKENSPFLEQDEILQIAESNSSKVAQESILDRVLYDSKISDESQNESGEWIYAMFLNVKDWDKVLSKRKTLIKNRKGKIKQYNLNETETFCNLIKEKASEIISSKTDHKRKRNDPENKENSNFINQKKEFSTREKEKDKKLKTKK